MAANLKIDKETLIKHRFWFLLPVIALCVLIAWICVLDVRSEAETNQKAAHDMQQRLLGIRTDAELRNRQWVEDMGKRKAESLHQKDEIWLREYDHQYGIVREVAKAPTTPVAPGAPTPRPKVLEIRDPLIIWPRETIAEWNKNNRNRDPLELRTFGENLGIIPSDYKNHYAMQFDKVLDLLPWLDETKDGVGAIRVVGGEGRHRQHAERLLGRHSLSENKDVDYKEAWLLQEDLAIRRELLLSFARVIDNYALMRPEWRQIQAAAPQPAPPAPAGKPTAPAASVPAASAPADDKAVTIDQASFYNSVWPITLPPKAAAPALNLAAWQGWQLDLQLVVEDRKRILRGATLNYSPAAAIPPAKLLVYFRDAQTGTELPQPLELDDVGDLAAAKATTGQVAEPAAKKLKDRVIAGNAGRISRVARAVQGSYTDVATVFNQNWLLEVRLNNPQGSSVTQVTCVLHNRGDRRLPVPTFEIECSDDPSRKLDNKNERLQKVPIRFPTDVLDAGARKEFTTDVRGPQPPQRVVAVREVMDWRTTPIKRLDRLEIGLPAHQHSDRTKVNPLLSYNFALKDYVPPSAPMGSVPPPGAAGPSYGLTGGPAESENHKVPLQRYVEVSKEVRRLPVALVMVVDSSNVNDVITAMSNSRLSFQVTQAVLNRIPSLGPPAAAVAVSDTEAPAAAGGQPVQGGNPGGGAGGAVARQSPPAAGGARPATPAPAAGQVPIGVVDDSSVVVLQIFGMVTLYESPDAEVRIEAEKTRAAAVKPATP